MAAAGVGRWWRPCPPWSSAPLLAASPKERACHCLPSTVRVNNKQWKVWEVANSSPWCCHNVSILGTQTHPRTPHSPPPPTPSQPLSTSASSLSPEPSPAPETPEGRSPHQPTPPSKKPREGVVPSGTGKPFILGSSLLTDSCVDWKVGGVLHGPRLHQRCGLSVPDLPCLLWAPLQLTTSPNAPIATHSHPPTYSNQPSSALYFCHCFSAATYRPAFSVRFEEVTLFHADLQLVCRFSWRPGVVSLWVHVACAV